MLERNDTQETLTGDQHNWQMYPLRYIYTHCYYIYIYIFENRVIE